MGWYNPSSTPGDAASNGLAERMVRRVKEGGRTCLIQSGLPYTWWPYAVQHFCAARNIQVVEGESVYNRRHKNGHCRALEVPFGAMVIYAPTKKPGKNPAFAPKNLYGLFLGYDFHPGGSGQAGIASLLGISSRETLRWSLSVLRYRALIPFGPTGSVLGTSLWES